jgi:hypothetical protein
MCGAGIEQHYLDELIFEQLIQDDLFIQETLFSKNSYVTIRFSTLNFSVPSLVS